MASQKTILITGASAGIGAATVRLFQARGWNVVATMRSPQKAADLATLDHVLVTRLDVLDEKSITASVEAAIERFGAIDVLVNNAGYGAGGPLELFDTAGIRDLFETNVIGLLAVTKAVLPHFRARHEGTIVNVGSMGGRATLPLGSLYHGSKYAVEGISEALSYELEAIGARIRLIEPGAVSTGFMGEAYDLRTDEAMPEYQHLADKLFSSPFKDYASRPEEVAEVIWGAVHDPSDQLRYVVGEDARQILAQREALDDEAFRAPLKEKLDL